MLVPLESFLATGTKFQTNYGDLYKLNSQLCLHFLHRIGFINSCKIDPIEETINKLSDRYLRYCRKHNEETNESPWLGTEEPTPSDADGKEIMEDEDMQSLITKNKDD